MRADVFLDLYKQLEALLNKMLEGNQSRHNSVVMDFIDSPEGRPYKEQLDLCREIRNILSHNADAKGEPVVEPAQALIDFLRGLLSDLRKPPLALAYAISGEKILKAHVNDHALTIMRKMQALGYSHIPVVGSGKFGVFSISTVFSHTMQNGFEKIDEDTRIGDFGRLLRIDKHVSERFLFMPCDTTLQAARAEFHAGKKNNKRLVIIFITKTGDEDETLMGMLTPWDVLEKPKQ